MLSVCERHLVEGVAAMSLFPVEEGLINDEIRNDVESKGKNQVGKAGGGSSRSQKGRRCQLTYTPNT